jgi:phospholipid/cholesterol/gamma-HCH transport system substrate-binding protein
VAAVAALVLAVVVVSILLLGGGGSYELRAQFSNASQLVTGAQVQVAGRPVGKVTEIRLTPNGLAEVVMEISDDAAPLRRGAGAQIRTGGLAGVANRFVVLRPGPPGAPEIPDGGVIGLDRTRAMVDLDAVLNGLDPKTRKDLQGLLRFGERATAGTGAQVNEAFRYLNPALAQTSHLTSELVRDEAALRKLVRATATVSGALASRDTDVEQGVSNSAATLRAVASERDALGRTLARAPEVLRTSGRRLGRLSDGIESVSDTVPLARLLAESGPVLAKSRPLVRDLRPVLGDLRTTLRAFPPLARTTVPSLRDTTRMARGMLPILTALRPYTPEVVGGFAGAYFGTIGGYYDANGHYVRIAPVFANDSIPGGSADGYRTGLTARCPGSAAEPAADGSNPWVDDPKLCDRGHDKRP